VFLLTVQSGIDSTRTRPATAGVSREVATLVNEVKQPGMYTAKWEASGVASGVYFYRLQAGNFVETKKLLLLR